MQEEENGTEEQDNEFDAAFAERAIASEPAQEPGEVGSSDDDATGERDLPDGFNDAADSKTDPAADQAKDDDAAQKLAEKEAEIERLKQSEKSQKGRVAALNKKLAEQRAAIKPPETSQEGDTPEKDGDDWEEFQREFPEMAAIVDKRLSKVAGQFDQVAKRMETVSSTTETLVEGEISAYREAQFDALRKRHSDFAEVAQSQEFAEWKQTANLEIQQKIQSEHADDASAVLDAFKEQAGWKKQTKPAAKTKSDVERINERRAAALKNSTGISSKKVGHSPRQDAESDDEFDAAFKAGASKKEKERAYRF